MQVYNQFPSFPSNLYQRSNTCRNETYYCSKFLSTNLQQIYLSILCDELQVALINLRLRVILLSYLVFGGSAIFSWTQALLLLPRR